MARAENMASQSDRPSLESARKTIEGALLALAKGKTVGGRSPATARALAMAISAHYAAALCSHAASQGTRADKYVAERWMRALMPQFVRDLEYVNGSGPDLDTLKSVVFDIDDAGVMRSCAGQERDHSGNLRPRL